MASEKKQTAHTILFGASSRRAPLSHAHTPHTTAPDMRPCLTCAALLVVAALAAAAVAPAMTTATQATPLPLSAVAAVPWARLETRDHHHAAVLAAKVRTKSVRESEARRGAAGRVSEGGGGGTSRAPPALSSLGCPLTRTLSSLPPFSTGPPPPRF